MTFPNNTGWEIVAGVTTVAAVAALALWLVMRRRPSAEEMERARRQFLVQFGRLVDGMLLDVCQVEAEDGRALTMLVYHYRIASVDYECSQDVTGMAGAFDAAQVRAGFPCTVRYQPGNHHNSIVVAEEWSGLRAGLPVLPSYDEPEPPDTSHPRPGPG